MKRSAILLLLLLAGCSTSPVAGFLDLVAPSHPPPPTFPCNRNCPTPAPPPGGVAVPPGTAPQSGAPIPPPQPLPPPNWNGY